MSRWLFSAPVLVVLGSAAPASAVLFTNTPGAPDPGIAAHEKLLVTFDAANAAGVTDTSRAAVITAATSTGGVRAAPAGTPKGGVYRLIGGGGSSVFDFSGWSRGRALASASLYWGSINRYNFVDFLTIDGRRVGGIGGADLPQWNGNRSSADTNRRVQFRFAPEDAVTALRLRSNGAAFEFDDIAASVGIVPEPASWAMMITGFGFIGFAMRRKGRAVAA